MWRSIRQKWVLAAAVLLLGSAISVPGMAHVHIDIGDGHEDPYRFHVDVHWRDEPAYVDQPNQVMITVQQFFGTDQALLHPGDDYEFTFRMLDASAGHDHGHGHDHDDDDDGHDHNDNGHGHDEDVLMKVPFHCHVHPWKEGEITVLEGEHHDGTRTHVIEIVDDGTMDHESMFFDPHHLTIHEGDTVRWVNEGSLPHTVSYGAGHNGGDHNDDGHNDDGHNDNGHNDNGHNDNGHGHHHGHGPQSPVENAHQHMTAIIGHGDETMELNLRPKQDHGHTVVGVYVADITPTASGDYSIRLIGELHGTSFDTGMLEFDPVFAGSGGTQFPPPKDTEAAVAQQESQINLLQSQLIAMDQSLESLENDRNLLLAALILIGIIVLAIAVVALIIGNRANRTANHAIDGVRVALNRMKQPSASAPLPGRAPPAARANQPPAGPRHGPASRRPPN